MQNIKLTNQKKHTSNKFKTKLLTVNRLDSLDQIYSFDISKFTYNCIKTRLSKRKYIQLKYVIVVKLCCVEGLIEGRFTSNKHSR